MGKEVHASDKDITIHGGGELTPLDLEVPGDISSAAFFLVAGLICPDAHLTIRGVGINPTRTGIIDGINGMGADISMTNERTEGGEPVADPLVESSELRGIDIQVRRFRGSSTNCPFLPWPPPGPRDGPSSAMPGSCR